MKNMIDDRRKILIVTPEQKLFEHLEKKISKNISKALFYKANDGIDAQSKINNDPPHVIFLDHRIQKLPAYRVIEWILSQPNLERVSIIILAEIPDKEHFVDEVVISRVQFLESLTDEQKILKCINRALNFVSSGDNTEFHLRFIAPGEELLHEGDMGDYVYIVKSGELEASHETKNGESVVLGRIETGEFVGEMSFVNHKPRSASVKALTQCELIEIPMNLLDHLLFQKPAWSKALVTTLTKRLEKTNERLTG